MSYDSGPFCRTEDALWKRIISPICAVFVSVWSRGLPTAALLFKTEDGMRVNGEKKEKDRDSSLILVAQGHANLAALWFNSLSTSIQVKKIDIDIAILFPMFHCRPFFTADILTCHSRKSVGVTNNINDGPVLLSVPICHDCVTVSQHAIYQKPKQLNGIQPSLILLFTPVLFLL